MANKSLDIIISYRIKSCPTEIYYSEHHFEWSSAMYDLCCCCLELPSRKSLWSEYEWMGQIEVYGQMLKECFNLIWPQNEFSRDQICEVCITQIRNAMQFRQRVVQSQAQLKAKLIAGGEDTVKIIKEENFDIEVEENEMDRLTVFTNTQELIVKDDEVKSINIEIEVPCDKRTQDTLSDDIELIKTEQSYEGSIFADVADTSCTEIIKSVKRKSPTKNRKASSKRTELIKTEQCDDGSEDFSEDADTSPKIRKSVKRKASGKDRKVIVKRKNIIIIPKESTKKDKEEDKIKRIEFRNVSYEKPRQNAALILEHSTIVPFKSTKGYFTCLYCNKQHVIFEELKSHIQQAHDNLTFKTITKSINRPHDRIKADVSDITCRICKKNIDNLENFVSHLIDIHNIKFIEDDVKKPADSILAYDLSNGKFKCCVCKSEFLFFKTLTYHMNTHSNDYVCDVCGRCFLLAERLRAHVMKHIDVKSVKCNMCDKICSSQVALHSHIRHQHKKLSYMCSICNLTFNSYKLRMKHLEEVHKRAPLNLTCKICSKQYTQPNTLNAHMRLEHLKIVKEPKHACSVCGMLFKTQSALAAHFLVHSGEKKFECDVCHKKYARAKTLREHVKIHRNDRRWSCSACAQAFVQKCSLKNHIRVHHPDRDYGELIVNKKSDVDCK